MATLAEAQQWARQQLAAADIASSQLDARLLLAYVLGVETSHLLAHPQQQLTPAQQSRYEALIARRAGREPLAYLTGTRWFFGLELEVSPAALIPRPETEELVERALRWLAARPAGASVVDVGTGSGAIAIALAIHAPAARLFASDLSSAALALARRNAARCRMADRIRFLQGDLLEPLPAAVDLIVANLPYVAERDREVLMPEVRDHEPALALFAGATGLDLIERLLAQAPAFLRPGGALLLEIGYDQGAAAAALARRFFPQAEVAVYPDLAGNDRILEICCHRSTD